VYETHQVTKCDQDKYSESSTIWWKFESTWTHVRLLRSSKVRLAVLGASISNLLHASRRLIFLRSYPHLSYKYLILEWTVKHEARIIRCYSFSLL